jgi:L-ascorbate metabolism protein UlaG (beta-lactamase superfamily)
MNVVFTQIDTACIRIDINGFVLLTDPAFDAAGGTYASGSGRTLYKTGSPAIDASSVGPVHLVLLSHDQHKDNLDNAGREFIRTVPRVISTKEARERLEQPNVRGIDEWETVPVPTDLVPGLRITGSPCQHATTRELNQSAGHVLGFLIEWDGQENGALYISGDTVLFEGIYEIARRYKIDTAVLHVGKAGFPALIGEEYLTFTTEEAIQAARLLKVNKFIPTHMEGWEHFLETPKETHQRIAGSDLAAKLVWLEPGVPRTLNI